MFAVLLSADLVRWFRLLCLKEPWRQVRSKALRLNIFHAPDRLIRTARKRIERVIAGWPTTEVILPAYKRIALISSSADPIPLRCPPVWSDAPRCDSVVTEHPCFRRCGGPRDQPGCGMADGIAQTIVAMASGNAMDFS